jgi:hypothetical protein
MRQTGLPALGAIFRRQANAQRDAAEPRRTAEFPAIEPKGLN